MGRLKKLKAYEESILISTRTGFPFSYYRRSGKSNRLLFSHVLSL